MAFHAAQTPVGHPLEEVPVAAGPVDPQGVGMGQHRRRTGLPGQPDGFLGGHPGAALVSGSSPSQEPVEGVGDVGGATFANQQGRDVGAPGAAAPRLGTQLVLMYVHSHLPQAVQDGPVAFLAAGPQPSQPILQRTGAGRQEQRQQMHRPRLPFA